MHLKYTSGEFWTIRPFDPSPCYHIFKPVWDKLQPRLTHWPRMLYFFQIFDSFQFQFPLIYKLILIKLYCFLIAGLYSFWESRSCCVNHGEASSWFDHVPEAARNCHWAALWKMWWKMCNLRLICASMHTCACLWWVQLWVLSGALCHMWRCGYIRCLLLQRVHTAGER